MNKPLLDPRLLNRRRLLKQMAAHGTGVAIASLTWLRPLIGKGNANAAESLSWGYGKENGPDVWSQLSKSYQTCATGMQQSPIDLETADIHRIGPDQQQSVPPIFHYRPMIPTILNTGRTIQVNGNGNNIMDLDGDRFTLLQLHFHHPSEHRLDGDRFPLELHLVHGNEQGELAVVGVFLKEGAENRHLKPVWNAMPHAMPNRQTKAITVTGATIDMEGLLPRNRTLFRYNGSLTTPPCSESVQWIVFKTPIELSTAQVAAFKAIFVLNARPIQPTHHRRLLEVTQNQESP